MASAILSSRNEPSWGDGKVCLRKYTNTTTTVANKNPPKINPNPKQTRHIHRDSWSDFRSREPQGHPPSPVFVSEDLLSQNRRSISLNEEESSRGGNVIYNLDACTRRELKKLKKRLISELDQVRILRNRIESKNFETRLVYPPTSHGPPPTQLSCVADVKSENPKPNPLPKQKKKNQGTKRENPFPDPNSKKATIEPATEKLVSSMMRRCGQILSKLMKHKVGWVFNNAVDAVALGLHDYHQVIKNPMDLGTVKTNLEKGFYKLPLDFAADVRLTFNNALTYNPKGHDVHIMAEFLSKKFEEMFNPAYTKFENEKLRVLGNLMAEERRFLPAVIKGTEQILIAKKMDSVKSVAPQIAAAVSTLRSGKMPKPKAKDPNKRLMSFEEKANLGMSLHELPPAKMAQLVQIIRKRNGHLPQDGDEIELDIEATDNETLWELDRFVCNYKKLINKIKRQGLVQNPMMTTSISKSPICEMVEVAQKGMKGDVGEEDVDIGEEIPMGNFPSVEIEKDDVAAGGATSGSSSSNSSGSSSGSSSSGIKKSQLSAFHVFVCASGLFCLSEVLMCVIIVARFREFSE
ncbi:Bromodomain domain-containing protein [Cephalotus follicularis]|uniref:Bromodomain domain-containing protein n=1 Tax=Cephalotus follicularis TaxID=3775 RepID=A0A1Q3D347_CEPFO|nr:Bromodomain domain-containing protein [Cephalotus follicularis]